LNWNFEGTRDLDKVVSCYRKVFDDDLSQEEIRQRTRGFNVHAFIISRPGEAPSGFALFRGKDTEVELWQAGVIPERRRQGAGACLMEQGEKEMARLGYQKMTVATYNRWNIMLSMLFKRGYRLVSSGYSARRQDLKMVLCRELSERRELRYALTEVCNFNCLFCHNEGLGREVRPEVSDREVFDVLKEAVCLGYTDITFTGGEPLLKKKRLHFLIRQLAGLPLPPALTLVTNGSLLDQHTIDLLAGYPGDKKIHLSLHATNEKDFRKVTRSSAHGMFEKVQENISASAQAGLLVKVNYVVLQGINHQYIHDAIDLARKIGASAIKFIELLVLPENACDYGMYYDADAICEQLPAVADGPIEPNPRKKVYHLRRDTRFIIEVQRLTCALGCSHCREVRDKTFSSDLQYHPCFVRSRSRFRVQRPDELARIFKNGDRIINGYASRYMESSPTLVQKEIYVVSRQEMFFALDDPENFRRYISNNGFVQVGASRFHEEYFRPQNRSPAWDSFERVLKIGWDYHHESRVELIYTDHQYTPTDDGLLVQTRFLDSAGPVRQKSAEFARHFLDRLEFESFMTLEWDIEIWQKNGLTLNLAAKGAVSTLKVEGSAGRRAELANVLKTYPGHVKPLMEPLPCFMLNSGA
jgi:molybdenum cofactor biosynthesis enzyme MoaA/GNAT superfamily N-acetyltransferase